VFEYTVSAPHLSTLCQNWTSYENDLKRRNRLAEERDLYSKAIALLVLRKLVNIHCFY